MDMIRLTSLALSLLVSLPLHAGEGLSEQRQQELGNLLVQDCGSCHGLRMRGGLGPALLPEVLQSRPQDYLVNVILEGRPGTAMPGWGALLSDEEARWMTERLLDGDLDRKTHQ